MKNGENKTYLDPSILFSIYTDSKSINSKSYPITAP